MAKEKSFKDYISGKDFGEFNVMSGPDPTFFGVLHKYSDELSQTWRKESTRQSYASYYKRHILPQLNGKALKDCELEDFERLFDSLPNRYKSSTIDSIRHLVGVVLEKAAEKEICPNVLWGTRHTLTESDTTLDDKEFVRLKKSLSIPQELSIASEILTDPMQRGEHMGLALMFCLGTRNSEACGANFGDFIAMQSDPSQFCLLIDKTTVRGGSELQTGGKTRNTPRLIPCPSALMRLIDERKRVLIDMVASHPENFPGLETPKEGLTAEAIERHVNRLPVACRGSQYEERCSAKHLTAEGAQILRRTTPRGDNDLGDTLALIDEDIRRPTREDEGITEKDPTAYLLRRNLGTHLYLLGLSEAEIQYVLGHDLEDRYELREHYRSEEKLLPIARKMAQRPIVNDIAETTHTVGEYYLAESAHKDTLIVSDVAKGDRILLTAQQNEPGKEMTISLRNRNADVEVRWTRRPSRRKHERVADIRGVYHKEYKRVEERKSGAEA